MDNTETAVGRRDVLRWGALAALGGAAYLATRAPDVGAGDRVWQIDPRRCNQCGNCATQCVLSPSAVKCVHAYAICGYCDFCSGYFDPDPISLDEGAENQLCPTGAIERRFIEDPYYEYTIHHETCVGCGKCVRGCGAFGNGSLVLQILHDRCLDCNECAIAAACPAQAIRRVPISKAYTHHLKSTFTAPEPETA